MSQDHRLVIDVEGDRGRVGKRGDRLSDRDEPVGLLRVHNRPRLVETVDERAVLMAWHALLE